MDGLARSMDCRATEMSYVGNEEKDVAAALALGCEAILLDRQNLRPRWGQHRTIMSLDEL